MLNKIELTNEAIKLLVEMMNKTQFPGELIEIAYEIKTQLKNVKNNEIIEVNPGN